MRTWWARLWTRPRTGEHAVVTDPWGDGDLAPFAAAVGAVLRVDEPGEPTGTRSAILGAFAMATAPAAIATPRRTAARPGPARLSTLLAGGMAVGVAGLTGVTVVAASGAGGPLYAVRVALEDLALPAAPSEREQAQVDRLDHRLADIHNADIADLGASRAALAAFASIADAALANLTPDAAAAERVRIQVSQLEQMTFADPATDELRAAAVRSARRLAAALAGTVTPAPDPVGPAGPPGPAPSGSPTPSRTANPSSSPAAPGGSGATPGGSMDGSSGTGGHASGTPAPSGPGTGGVRTPRPSTSAAPTSGGSGDGGTGSGPGSGSGSGTGGGSPSPAATGGPGGGSGGSGAGTGAGPGSLGG